MRSDRLKKEYLLFAFGTLLYVITVSWVNFHASQWYNFDIYADASIARRMAEQNTLFPENWIFGNQYYIIATPVAASLFYRIIHSSVLAMSCATSLMYALILLGYAWAVRPIFSTRAWWAGLFCMAGATIVGDSVSSSTYGFQILYSMASFYACYLLVIVLHLGIWVRLRKNDYVSPIVIALALIACFALGIQSPRETLSLCIPMLLTAGFVWFRNRNKAEERKSVLFALSSFTANLLGLAGHGIVRQYWGSHYLSNVNTVGADTVVGNLVERIQESARAFLDLVGLRYISYGWKWMPLAGLGLLLLGVALAALVIGLKKRRDTDASVPILFCWVSLLGVFAAGAFVVQIRAIYYFVWYLLVPLSVSLLCDTVPEKGKTLFCLAVILCGAFNYFYNVYPDVSKYQDQKQFYIDVVSWLEERGTETVYGDYQTPTISACSGDRIRFCSVFPNAGADPEKQDALLIPYGSPIATEAYRSVDPKHAVLILSDSPYDELSGYRYLTGYTSETYQAAFESCFELEGCFESPQVTYYAYSFSSPELFADSDIP